jgi:LmbE family N-acetylglucosaminyl deacetylase
MRRVLEMPGAFLFGSGCPFQLAENVKGRLTPMAEASESLDRVMVIAAHPDDPEFGCAGSVLKWAEEGKTITYVLLTSGDKGSHDPDLRPGRLAGVREVEQRAAAHDLGVQKVVFLRYPDGLLVNNLDLRRQLANLLRQHRPHIVVTIDPWRHYQLHPDHRAAGQAALDAVYAAREWYIFPEQLVDDMEPWRVKEVYLFWTENADYWEDITCCIDGRIAALAHHASQVGLDVNRLTERIKKAAKDAGEAPGYEYAEGFKRFQF